MDVLYFFKERTQFIRQHYIIASEPFYEIKRKIEAEESPFNMDYGKADEPPFLDEWIQAETSIEVLGRSCISMLSAALRLYFSTWQTELNIECGSQKEKKRYFQSGFINGYKRLFGERFGLKWEDCPANFDFLEQITIVRNMDQHPDYISSISIRHKATHTTNFEHLFFAREEEVKVSSEFNSPWFQPVVHVSRERLFEAIKISEILTEWLEEKFIAKKIFG